MTPDQEQLVRRVHRQVGHLRRTHPVLLTAGDVIDLINIVRLDDRQGDAVAGSQELSRAAESNIEELRRDA